MRRFGMTVVFTSVIGVFLFSQVSLAKEKSGPKVIENPELNETLIGSGKIRVCSALRSVDLVTDLQIVNASLVKARAADPMDKNEYQSLSERIDLKTNTGLNFLVGKIDELLALAKTDDSLMGGKSIYALIEMRNLARLALGFAGSEHQKDRFAAIESIRELAYAFNSQFLRPVPKTTYAISAFSRLRLDLNPLARFATNVQGRNDDGRFDPTGSTFWSKPFNVSQRDLLLGAGAVTSLDMPTLKCDYAGPHKGQGIHPAFDVTCVGQDGRDFEEGRKIRIKFGAETKSGPFNTRIYDVLGFNTIRIEYFNSLYVNYDRRIFSESNSSTEVLTYATVTGLDKIPIRLGNMYNPFDYIKWAVLKNGQKISGAELMARLLVNSQGLGQNVLARKYEQLRDPQNYRVDFENQIDHLILDEGSMKFKGADGAVAVGSWDYDDPAHFNRRDVRGSLFLAAYLNNYDTRSANTEVQLVKSAHGFEMRNVFSDVGSGLGAAAYFFALTDSDLSGYPTEWLRRGDRGELEILGFTSLDANESLNHLTINDAKWMARLIGKIEPEQFKRALIVSGFSSAEVNLFQQRLLIRRDNMVDALGLADELGYKYVGSIPRLNYDPQVDGPMATFDARLGRRLVAPDRGLIVVDGTLRHR